MEKQNKQEAKSHSLTSEFTPYEQALELKRLGFDEPCFGFYDESLYFPNNENQYGTFCNQKIDAPSCSAPLYQQAFRWFREKHNWQHSIEPTADQHRFEVGYNYWVWNSKTGEEYHTMSKNRPTGDWEYETYEEAEQACLKKLIEIVKGGNK
jgi:hypothetical protein